MFGRTKSSRIRLAEDALRDGRLDEALRRATSPDLADDARTGRILAELCEPLLRRAQDHLIAERFSDALADVERAARCGVMREKVEDWRQRILSAIHDRQRAKRQQQDAVDAARQHIDNGELTLARGDLEDVTDEGRVNELQQRAGRQAEHAEHALADANSALARGDIASAVRAAAAARRLHAGANELDATESAICDAALTAARESFAAGRLDRVRELLSQLGDLGRRHGSRTDLERAVALARQAADAFRHGDYHQSDILLGRLLQITGDAQWLAATRESLRTLAAQAAA